MPKRSDHSANNKSIPTRTPSSDSASLLRADGNSNISSIENTRTVRSFEAIIGMHGKTDRSLHMKNHMLDSTFSPLQGKSGLPDETRSSSSSAAAAAAAASKDTLELDVDTSLSNNVLNRMHVPSSFLGTTGSGGDDEEGLEEVGRTFRRGTVLALTLWLSLMAGVYLYAPIDSWEAPVGLERNAHLLSAILLLVTNGSRILPLLLRDEGLQFCKSGIIMGTMAVQAMAFISNVIMAFWPTPVVLDPYSQHRTHLVRWAEWTPLAFLLTFLTDNLDAPLKRAMALRESNSKDQQGNNQAAAETATSSQRSGPVGVHFVTAIVVGLSTFSGFLFPFAPRKEWWLACFVYAWITFGAVYVMFYERTVRYGSLKDAAVHKKLSALQQERYELIRSSYALCLACCTTWTLLSVAYSLVLFAHDLVAAYPALEPWLTHPALPVVSLSLFEVVSKIWYLSVLVDAYDKVFDESSRAVRRLEELRNFMSAVWESSSDVIVFCGATEGRVSARVSPAFLKLVGLSTGRVPFLNRGDVSLVLEIFPQEQAYYVFAIDLSKPVTRADAARHKKSLQEGKRSLILTGTAPGANNEDVMEDRNLAIIAQLAIKACKSTSKAISIMQEFYPRDSDRAMTCEAKMGKLEGAQSVIVLRDISDRVQRFEAEKLLVQEVTTRKKDAEANRFTRHEVKNGILATIGLLDHLRETMEQRSLVPARIVSSSGSTGPASQSAPVSDQTAGVSTESIMDDMDYTMLELDSALRDILDTIMDEAMAREIIYGEYEPRKEPLKVVEVLASLRRRSSRRFPLVVRPHPFPLLGLDRQLLRYLYRNAVSNACKYGLKDGIVETIVHYNEDERTLTMEIINAPGEGHLELTTLPEDVVNSVFEQGTQLKTASKAATIQDGASLTESAGNGAWIMQKCAQALGGTCAIRFESKRTVFNFTCPVLNCEPTRRPSQINEDEFHLPETTWGVVIDDSLIQRKLLDRFLRMAGIAKGRRRVLGKDAEEVHGFTATVADLMQEYPQDRFLLIADENLDIVEGGAKHQTVSGSGLVEQLRTQLATDDERRLLALIRSANDSLRDIDIYKARAHGFLPKEPLHKDRVLDMIKPWWLKRFANTSELLAYVRETSSDDESFGPSAEDLREVLKSIDEVALSARVHDSDAAERWTMVREKLHALKGDLKTLVSADTTVVAQLVDAITELRSHEEMPARLPDMWRDLRIRIGQVLG